VSGTTSNTMHILSWDQPQRPFPGVTSPTALYNTLTGLFGGNPSTPNADTYRVAKGKSIIDCVREDLNRYKAIRMSSADLKRVNDWTELLHYAMPGGTTDPGGGQCTPGADPIPYYGLFPSAGFGYFFGYDGKLVEWRSATTHVLTHSLHYGLAVFEGVRAYKTAIGTAIYRLKEHTDRLFNSAHIYMMKIPFSRAELMDAQLQVVRENGHEACYVRPIAFYGSEKMGVSPVGAKVHVAIAAWPWGAYLGPEALEKGIRVKTSSYARHHVNVTMARAKMSGTYPNSVLATLEATMHGYDEGLLLDVDGFVAEGAGENIFVVKDGKIYEPELTSALTGITRTSVIELAGELGYEVGAKRLTRDDIYIADEAFFTGTAAEVTPIRELDGRIIGEGKAGPITKKIQKAFFDVVTGKDKKRRKWLTPVKSK